MTDKELRKLSRPDLLELLIEQSRENEALKAQVEALTAKLESREIAIGKAGSIAEASLQLNGVFEAAQRAGEQYLRNIQRLSGDQERVCRRMEEDTKLRCRKMLSDAEAQAKNYIDRVYAQMNAMLRDSSALTAANDAGEAK